MRLHFLFTLLEQYLKIYAPLIVGKSFNTAYLCATRNSI